MVGVAQHLCSVLCHGSESDSWPTVSVGFFLLGEEVIPRVEYTLGTSFDALQLNWNQFTLPRLVVPLAGALNTTYKS